MEYRQIYSNLENIFNEIVQNFMLFLTTTKNLRILK